MSKFVGGLSTSGVFERSVYLINLLFYFQISVWFVEGFHHQFEFGNLIVKIILALIILRTYQGTLKALQYSFWAFSIVIFLYLFDSFTTYLFTFDGVLATCYFLLLGILSSVMYLISSPLFYPRVRWWEYDFRFQGDLKAKVLSNEAGVLAIEARLTDLRRGAGCLVLFPDIEIGKEFSLQIFDPPFPTNLRIKFMSKRPVAPGRGHTYGIKFLSSSPEDKKTIKELTNFWLSYKRARLQKKFELIGKT